MTFTALTDTLQSLELDAKSTFADDPFVGILPSKPDLVDGSLGSDLIANFNGIGSYGAEDIPQPPVGAAELETQITGQLESLHQINIESLADAIPQNPGAEAFDTLDLTSIQDSMGSLTTSIVGDSQFGQLNVNIPGTTISAEFDAFLKGASAFPSRLLNALIQAFKALLEKLRNPNDWLNKLSEEALTDVFVEQVRGVAASLPPVAMRQGAEAIKTRGEQALELAQMIKGLNRQTATEADLEEKREKARRMELILDDCDRVLVNATLRIDGFKAEEFIQLLKNLPSDAGREIKVLSQIFEPITSFVEGLSGRIADITTKLKELIDKVINLLDTGIAKVQDITNKIVDFIKEKLSAAQQALQKMEEYISQAIGSIEKFIKKAGNQVESIVAQAKQAINQVTETAEAGIKSLAGSVKSQTDKIKDVIESINGNIDQNLNDEALKEKIYNLLDRVTSQLKREEVAQAIDAADNGIKKMADALEQITLKSTFELAVSKSKDLEASFRKIDAATLGTAQKTALGVGKKVLESVDVPGIVNPKLKEAFEDVLAPVANIVDQVQQEVNQVRAQVTSFEPGQLLEEYLQPHIDRFVSELNQYRPSELLKSIKDLYQKILSSLNKLDPNRLIVLLDRLYQQVAKMAEALSPEGLIKLLDQQKMKIQDLLNKLPVGDLIDRIKQAVGSVEKLFAGLGLDEIMNSGFWTDLKEIFELNLNEPIRQLGKVQENINEKVSNIKKGELSDELDDLKNILTTFSKNAKAPEADYIAAKEALSNKWDSYTTVLKTLGQENFAGLESDFKHRSKIDFYYEDLVERLQGLHMRLANEEITSNLEHPYNLETQYEAWIANVNLVIENDRRTPEVGRLVPGNEHLNEMKVALKSNDDLIAAFKDALPAQLETQFIGPIRNILNILNETLAQPKEFLDKIEEMVSALTNAPARIAAILEDQTERLRDELTDTITTLSQAVGNVIDRVAGTLRLAHTLVETTLQSLRPTTLLNTFYPSDLKLSGLQLLLQKLTAESRDPISELIWGALDTNQQRLLTTDRLTDQQKKEAIVVAFNKLLMTDTLYTARLFRDIEMPAYGQELAEKSASLSQDQRLRLNRIALETVYGDAVVLSMQSIFPFLMKTLEDLYPEAVIQELDRTHAKIVKVVRNLPQNIGAAVQDAYIALMDEFEELIGTRIDQIFLELKKPLWRLQRDLGVGLEDIGGSYRRLLSAVPV